MIMKLTSLNRITRGRFIGSNRGKVTHSYRLIHTWLEYDWDDFASECCLCCNLGGIANMDFPDVSVRIKTFSRVLKYNYSTINTKF